MANWHYSLGPLVTREDASLGKVYCAPPGATLALDLAPLAPQSQLAEFRPVGLMLSDAPLSSEYDLLAVGDCREINSTAAMRENFQASVGYRPNGDKLVDLLYDCLIGGSDPQGESGPLPLMPDVQSNLDLHLAGHSLVKRERFDWATSPHKNKVKAVLQKQFEQHFADAKGGRTKDKEQHRRILDAWCEKYKLNGADDWKELVPQKLQRDVPGRLKHATTVSDDFNRADGAIGSGWTSMELGAGTALAIVSNTLRTDGGGGSSTNHSIRFDSDLSSADHYAQADILASTDDASRDLTTLTRMLGTVTLTFYFFHAKFSDNQVEIYKRVAGTYTLVSSSVSQTLNASTTYALKGESNGSTQKLFIDGVEKISLTDSAITTGVRAGLRGFRSGVAAGYGQFDNFTASDLAGSATLYTQLERGVRGLTRGIYTGGL